MSGVRNPQDWLVESIGGGVADSGATVNVSTSLGLPAVWSAISMIAGHLAGLEISIKRRTGQNGFTEVQSHPAYRLLNRLPNDFQTPYTFRQTFFAHALLQGNGRAYIRRNGLGQPVELIPLLPWDTYGAIVDGEKYHVTYINPDYPSPTGADSERQTFTFPDRDVFHVPGLSYNGFWGVHLLQIARDALGLGISGQTATGATLKNNGRPGVLIEQPVGQLMTAAERREFLDEMNRKHRGPDNAGRTALLRAGMKANVLPMSAADSQLLELRQMSKDDVNKLFLIPDDNSNAYKSRTERAVAYKNDTLAPWCRKLEQEVYKKLFSDRDRLSDEYFCECNTDPLIKGDPNTLADYTGKMRLQGAMSGNEVRILHGMNPADDPALDQYSNPNITTPDASDPPDADEPPDVEAQAIRSVIAPLLAYESRRVRKAAGKDGNFLSWADSFYEGFEDLLGKACREANLEPALAAEYCERSKGDLLELTAVCTPEQLKAGVTDLVGQWSNRLGEFASVQI